MPATPTESDPAGLPRRTRTKKPRVIEGALTSEERKKKQREVLNRKRKLEGKPPIGELGKKRKLNRRKNQKRRKRLNIGPERQRLSGIRLARRGDGRTLWVRRRKAAGTWKTKAELRYESEMKELDELEKLFFDPEV